jgi:hypothetical protein
VLSPTLISFNSRFELSNPYPVNITIDQLALPAYATTITNPFKVYVKRNSYFVCYLSQSFSIALTPGSLSVALIASTLVAGLTSSYTFTLTLTHSIAASSKVSFYFSPSYFSVGGGVGCQSSQSTTCSVASSSNLVEVTSAVTSSSTSVQIVLSGILNPSAVGAFSPIAVSTYALINGSYFLVDSNQADAVLSLTARPMLLNNLNITSSSYIVAASATYTFSLQNNNAVPLGSKIRIYVPSLITFTTAVCSQLCITGIYNGSQGIQLEEVGPLAAGMVSSFTVDSMVNPLSTQPTPAFSVEIYDSANQLLEYLSFGPSFRATTPSSMLMSVTPSSGQNSVKNTYMITFSTSYTLSAAVALVLVVPSSQSCPSCVAQPFNSSHNELVFYNQSAVGNSWSLSLPSFGNFYSLQPQSWRGAVMSNDLLYLHANATATLTTSTPSTLVYSYTFTKQQLATATDLLVSGLTSATLWTNVGSIVLSFGSDFDLSGVTCINVGYVCTNSSSQFTLVVSTAGSLSSITIKNVLTPALSPSTNITL